MAKHVCPVWVAHLLASPIRKLLENPKKILSPFIKQGMTVLDIGCAMGFFSLPLAEMVGENGRVICVDVQKKMIDSVRKRAYKAGLSDRIKTHLCNQSSLGLTDLKERIDFALAFAVVHEVIDVNIFFSETYEIIGPEGIFMVAEPKLHVSETEFCKTLSIAEKQGFKQVKKLQNFLSWGVLLEK